MLKGQVFSRQLFENQIFALFINTFLDGKNGVSDNYKNGMAVTYSGNSVTINSGAVCIQGRFLEEDTSTTLAAGTDAMYCKLVIEIDLDKQNTESDFQQGAYKIITSASGYPSLIQTDIVKNNAGVYQYELARFKTGTNGITNFQDKRTFLNFDSIYSKIETEYRTILEQLKEELANVEDGSAYVLNTIESKSVSQTGIDITIKRQGKIAVLNFTVNGTAQILNDFEIPSQTLRPADSYAQTYTNAEGASSTSLIGPVSVNLYDSGNGIGISINKNASMKYETDRVSGTMTYICL